MVAQPHGLVPHVIVGSIAGADATFRNPDPNQKGGRRSAHFGVAKDGHLVQWVDTVDKAWAEQDGNALWWSAECEGVATEPHTPAQIDALAHLAVWLRTLSPFTLHVTDDPFGQGIISHRNGGDAWGGHTCPGDPRHAQRGEIVLRAKGLENPPPPQEADDMPMIVLDPKGPDDQGRDSHWEIDADGNVANWNAARFLKSLGQMVPQHPRIIAAVLDPSGDGVVLFGDDARKDDRGHWVRSTYKILVGS